MIIELIVNRGWQVLIDGKAPQPGWNAPDDDGRFAPILRIEQLCWFDEITRIVPIRESGGAIGFDDDWTGEDDFGPRRPAYLSINLNGEFRVLKITHIVYGSSTSATELLVTTEDGKAHDIDEITTYIRAEG